jgi:hypothetical protein
MQFRQNSGLYKFINVHIYSLQIQRYTAIPSICFNNGNCREHGGEGTTITDPEHVCLQSAEENSGTMLHFISLPIVIILKIDSKITGP